MTPEQTIEALEACRALAWKLPTEPAELPESLKGRRFGGIPHCRPAHLAWMADRAVSFVREGRTDKAMRWLGFIQGTLWALGYASIEDLKTLNMPSEAAR